jgi:hypothetical protein
MSGELDIDITFLVTQEALRRARLVDPAAVNELALDLAEIKLLEVTGGANP